MKKYIFFILLIIINTFFIIKSLKTSYSFVDCENTIIKPSGVTTLNFNKYIEKNNLSKINYICSYDKCYHLTSSNYYQENKNIIKYLSSKISSEEKEIVYAKGYTITEINYNNCN